MSKIPMELVNSQTMQLIERQGWNYEGPDGGQVKVEICPFCKKSEFKFYINVMDPAEGNRDGLFICYHGKCQATGNLRKLKEQIGERIPGVESRSEWAGKGDKKPDALPDVDICHAVLLGDAESLDYLISVRGFTLDVIKKQKLGIKEGIWFREAGTTKALVIPYLVNGNAVYVKYRTLPPAPKDFVTPSGWESPLYNGEILQEGLHEVVFVEGEADALSCLSNDIEHVVGVPGASFKKATWIEALDKIAPEKMYILYDNDKAGIKGAQDLASRIGIEKVLRIKLPDFTVTVDGVERAGKDVNEWFMLGGGTKEKFEDLKRRAEFFDVTGVTSSGSALEMLEDELAGKVDLAPSYVTQWSALNRHVGFEDGDVIDILAPEKIGKSLSVKENIKTPTGWVRNGDIKVGDEVASIDGQPSFVTGVFPQGILPAYKVTFSDGRSVLASADHLWTVLGTRRNKNKTFLKTTMELSEWKEKSRMPSIPTVSGDFGQDSGITLDPWLLGILLGDGCFRGGTPTLATADVYIVEKANNKVKNLGCRLVGNELNSVCYHISGPRNGSTENLLTKELRALGLWGKNSYTKFIPKNYLNATKETRLELLRGLMDSDGFAGRDNTLNYTTVNSGLAEDVQTLVRSLGGTASVLPRKSGAYTVGITFKDQRIALSLPRRLERLKDRTKGGRLRIKSIEYVGEEEMQCISVSHPSQLFITTDYIVTHNTTFGLNLLDHMVNTYGEDGLCVCLEMTQARLARKWVAMVTGFEDNITVPGSDEAKAKLEELKAAVVVARQIQVDRKADLYFAYPQQVKTPEDVFKLIRDCIRRYGVKWVMFDNLQRLCDDTLENKAHRTIHLSQISKGFAKLAKDYKIKLVRILQPRQIEDGQIVQSRHTDGSSQIAKDCDAHITLWRSPMGITKKSQWDEFGVADVDSTFDPRMKVSVGLSRYSSGGECGLYFDGARSQVRDLEAERPPRQDYNKLIEYETEAPKANIPTEPISI